MKHIGMTCVAVGIALAMTAGLARAERNDEGDVYAQAMGRAEQAGTLILFVYSMDTTCCKSAAAKQALMTTGRGTTTGRMVVQYIEIEDRDPRYSGYRRQFEGDTIPFWVLAKPDGTFLAGGDYETVQSSGRGGWRETVAAIAEDYPPIGATDRARIAEVLDQAEVDLEAGRYGDVEPLVTQFRRVWHTPELAERSRAFCAAYDEAVEELTSRPVQLAESGQILEAALAYDRVIEVFGKRNAIGKQAAADQRSMLIEYPAVRRELEETRRERAAAARAAENADDQPETDVAAPDEPSAEDDADVVAQDGPDQEDPPAADDGESAAALLNVAQMYHQRGLADRAKAKLQECIDTFPETAAAEEARQLLTQW